MNQNETNKNLFQKKLFQKTLIAIIAITLLNIISHKMLVQFRYASINLLYWYSFAGSFMMVIYYVINFIFFYLCFLFYNTKAKILIWIIFIMYFILSIPILDITTLPHKEF